MEEIRDVPEDKIVYVDETGIDTYLHRSHGYAPRGDKVICTVRGRKYQRVSIVAGLLGKEVIAPMEYSNTMASEFFEAWFAKWLLPSVSSDAVIVMDNAAFHRKKALMRAADENGRRIVFLPPYSPELNKIENYWGWLKQKLRKIISSFRSISAALSYVFQVD